MTLEIAVWRPQFSSPRSGIEPGTSSTRGKCMDDQSKLINYVNNKVPSDTFFKIPLITTSQVAEFIRKLDPGKSTGLDGVCPRILKLACDIISPSIAALINKSITSGCFPNQFRQARFIRFSKMALKMIHQITAQFLFYPPSQKYLKIMSTVT